jgi:hypothetical protein
MLRIRPFAFLEVRGLVEGGSGRRWTGGTAVDSVETFCLGPG